MSCGHWEEALHTARQFQMLLCLEWDASARSGVGAGHDRQNGRDVGRPTEKGGAVRAPRVDAGGAQPVTHATGKAGDVSQGHLKERVSRGARCDYTMFWRHHPGGRRA